MGCYVNPTSPGQTKRSWLEQNAIPLTEEEAERMVDNQELFGPYDDILLCHVDNLLHDAVAVCYGTREFETFTDPRDRRPHEFWLASRKDVEPVCPTLKDYLPQ